MARRSPFPVLFLCLALGSLLCAAGCSEGRLRAVIESPDGDAVVREGDTLSFEGGASGGEAPYAFAWSFGGAAPGSASEDPGPVTFASAGLCTVELRVTDASGDTDTATVAVEVLDASGALRSTEEIRSYWNAIQPSLASVSYASAPVLTADDAGYEGVLSPDLVSEGVAWVNFYRWLAGLPDDVTEDATYRVRCQKGAHVLAVLALQGEPVPDPHHPPEPPGATAAYVANVYGGPADLGSNTGGWIACASSNVFRGWGGSAYTPVQTVDGYMDDYGNDMTLGHRRWILYPRLSVTAFGVVGGSGVWASCMYVVERPSFTRPAPSYEFVAYPSPGYYPLQCFPSATALWSLSANASLYDLDASTAVTVVRLSDGQDLGVTAEVKTAGYGITPTLSFDPGEAAEDETYRVTVRDVYDEASGTRFDHEYTVTFFDLAK